MKFLRNRILIAFFAAVIAVFLVVSTPVPQEAQAQVGVTALILAALQVVQDALVGQILQSFTDILGGIGDAILGFLMPFLHNTWANFGIEKITAYIEGSRYTGDLVQTEIDHRTNLEEELTRYDNVKENIVTAGTCQSATALALSIRGEDDKDEYANAITSAVRSRDNFVSSNGVNYPNDEFQTIPQDLGPVVAAATQADRHFDNYCCSDEQKGTVGSICQAAEEQCGKDRDVSAILGCNTVPREDFGAIGQMLSYIAPNTSFPIPLNPDDSSTWLAYLDQVRENAQNEPHKTLIIDVAAAHLEPIECPGVPQSAYNRLDFVNEVDRRLGRPQIPDRPCPSQAEFFCYLYQHMGEDPSYLPGCDLGEEDCLLAVEGLRVSLQHQHYQLKERETLMTTIDRINKGGAPTPFRVNE